MMAPFSPARLWRFTPLMALATAVLLLIAGASGVALSERDFRQQKIEEAGAHARVLAASVSAALAFGEPADALLAIEALSENPEVDALGVYDRAGALFAGRAGPHGGPPERLTAPPEAVFADGYALAGAWVEENDAQLGVTFVRLSTASAAARWIRYGSIALLIVMAGVIVAVVGAAHQALSSANAELTRRAEALSAEIAERKKAEQALAQAQKMEAIGRLTGGVAHDFNNLLMVIQSGLRLLDTRKTPEERDNVMAAMRQAVDRGAGLTRQLLAFSRRQKFSPEVVDIAERLEAMRALLERSLREDILIRYEIGDDLRVVKVDPGQFELAILNLSLNARDAMPEGGQLVVRAEQVEEPGHPAGAVRVSVSDEGVGMTPEVMAQAFDPFFTTKSVGKGTGLGLSQVYGFALASGGRSEIESTPGAGSKVTLVLPCTTEARPAPVAAPVEAATPSGDGAVLVVEDDDGVAVLVCEMLRDLGYSATRVANADAALQALESGPPVDLVFSDIIMPGGMNGIGLAQEIRRRRPDLPVLLTTGYDGKDGLDDATLPVLRKPYERDDLRRAIAALRIKEKRA